MGAGRQWGACCGRRGPRCAGIAWESERKARVGPRQIWRDSLRGCGNASVQAEVIWQH